MPAVRRLRSAPRGFYLTGRGENNAGAWADYPLTLSDPELELTDPAVEVTPADPLGLFGDWTGVLSDVTPGDETQDSGGGGDDLVVMRCFPD